MGEIVSENESTASRTSVYSGHIEGSVSHVLCKELSLP
jgi:hypothetical protein